MSLFTTKTVPGLAEAMERERELWDEAFLDVPEFICGVEVQQFTLAHFGVLNAMRSPLICGGLVEQSDLIKFMWVISPQREQSLKRLDLSTRPGRARLWLRQFWFTRRIRKIDTYVLEKEIRRYMDDALLDAPRGSGDEAHNCHWGLAIGVVTTIGTVLGWPEREILNMPTKRTFQYLKICRKHLDPEFALFKPSDQVVSDWLAAVNARGS